MPPAGLFFTLWLAFPVLLLVVSRATGAKAAFRLGWLFGFGFFLLGLYWIAFALTVDLARLFWLIPFAAAGLPAVLAIFFGLVTMIWHRIGAQMGIMAPLAFALVWGAGEWARGHLFTGFPWNLIAYAWDRVLPVEQLAAVIGAYGLSMLTVAAAAMPASLWLENRGARLRGAALCCVMIAGLIGGGVWGAMRLAAYPAGPESNHAGIQLRLVQPGIDQREKWQSENWPRHFNLHLQLSESDTATHVIWPETAATFFLDRDTPARSAIAAIVPPGGAAIVGAPRIEGSADSPRYYNSAQIISASGAILDSYDKAHLVPFGEYVPFSQWLPVAKIVSGAADYSAGPGPRTVRAPGLPPFSPLICYEAIFPGAVTAPADAPYRSADAAPLWMLNLTNDAWYGKTAGPHQHFAIARMRAIEEGLPLVRVATNGISGLIDPLGRVLHRLPLGEAGALDVPLPLPVSER